VTVRTAGLPLSRGDVGVTTLHRSRGWGDVFAAEQIRSRTGVSGTARAVVGWRSSRPNLHRQPATSRPRWLLPQRDGEDGDRGGEDRLGGAGRRRRPPAQPRGSSRRACRPRGSPPPRGGGPLQPDSVAGCVPGGRGRPSRARDRSSTDGTPAAAPPRENLASRWTWARHRTVIYAATVGPWVTTRRRHRPRRGGCGGRCRITLTARAGRRSVSLLPGGVLETRPGVRLWRCDIAVYVYRCPEHGRTETNCAMGAATAVVACPMCGAVAGRVFTAPRLALGSPVRRALIERTERSREQPDVVSAPPPGPGARQRADLSRNPALRRLPRP
jgi:hypothetical protein